MTRDEEHKMIAEQYEWALIKLEHAKKEFETIKQAYNDFLKGENND